MPSTSRERRILTVPKTSGAPRRRSSIAANPASEITASRRNSAICSVGVTAFSAASRTARSAAAQMRADGIAPSCQRSIRPSRTDAAATAGKRRMRAARCSASARGRSAYRRIRVCVSFIPSILSSASVPTRASASRAAYYSTGRADESRAGQRSRQPWSSDRVLRPYAAGSNR